MFEQAFYEFMWQWITTGQSEPSVETPILLMFALVGGASAALLLGRILLQWVFR